MNNSSPAQLPWETHMLSKCNTCLTPSEEVDLAAPGSVWESLRDPNEAFFGKTFGCCCKRGWYISPCSYAELWCRMLGGENNRFYCLRLWKEEFLKAWLWSIILGPNCLVRILLCIFFSSLSTLGFLVPSYWCGSHPQSNNCRNKQTNKQKTRVSLSSLKASRSQLIFSCWESWYSHQENILLGTTSTERNLRDCFLRSH